MTRRTARGCLTAWLLLWLPAAGTGQEEAPGAALDRVESLISHGDLGDARRSLERWWDEARPLATGRDVQRALWLRGRLTLDALQAELDYQRLVVEYPGGPWSDDALVRLAEYAHARDDLGTAARHFRTLLRDYPESPHRREARQWLDRFGDASGAVPARVVEAPEEEAEGPRPYAVQLGAFSSERRARRLAERARSAGLDPRLVRIPGSGLLRVRVGRFPDSPAAEAVLGDVRTLGFEATIVTDALDEVDAS